MARIGLEVDRLIITAREDAPEEIRTMLRPEIEATVEAIAATLDQIARELPTHIAVGLNERSSESRLHARAAMDVLSARMIQLRPVRYIATASSAEMENTGSFIDSLACKLTRHIEHLIDESLRSRPPGWRRISRFRVRPRLRIRLSFAIPSRLACAWWPGSWSALLPNAAIYTRYLSPC